MDIINLRKKGINYLNFFKKGKVSKMYSICILDHPFFYSDAVNGSQIETDKLCKIIKCKDLYKELDLSLKILYSFVGENREYNINNFIFLSLIEIKNKFNKYIYFYDVGIKYLGIGKLIMLSYHPISSKFFFRIDGGINSYEREKKYNFYYNFNPLIDESHIYYFFNYQVNKLFDFNQFVNIQK